MKQAKRITLLLLVLVLMLAFGTARAEALEVKSSGTCGENLIWIVTDDGTLAIFGTGEMENYSYRNRSPWYNSGLIRHVVIQDGVTSIGEEAFMNCWALSSVELPESLTSIGDAAFKGCDSSLTVIELPESVVSIGNSAFSGCDSLASIHLPEGLSSIGDTAFYDCGKLTSIELPKGLSSIGYYTFLNCVSLQRITVSEDNMHYSSDEAGVLYNKDQTELIAAPGAIQTCSVPAGVTHIRDTAFNGCRKLTSIELPEGLVSIGSCAFQYCWDLTELHFPVGLLSIGNAAFDSCDSLTGIVFPAGLISIGDYAFELCDNLSSITFCGNVPLIGTDAFDSVTAAAYYPADNLTWTKNVMQNYGGKLTWIPCNVAPVIASGWSGTTEWTLTADGLLTIHGTGNMKNYDYDGGQPWLNKGVEITKVVIEEGVAAVGTGAFRNLTTLESVTLPENSLTKIGEAAFYGCSSLTEITIPDTIHTVWAYTFKNCTALSSVKLSRSLVKLDQGAFEGCTSLPYIYIPGDTEIIGSWCFKGCTALAEADMTWADATQIREGAFKSCSALTEIYLPGGIQAFGDSAFYGIGAGSFTVPNTVTSIGPWCFARAALNAITFEGDAPAIGEGAFNKLILTARYPGDHATWTADIMQNYGGAVTWEAN